MTAPANKDRSGNRKLLAKKHTRYDADAKQTKPRNSPLGRRLARLRKGGR